MCAFRLRNKAGDPVDPVPFFVAALTAFLVTHAWGPLYLGAFNVSLVPAYAILTVLYIGIVAALFYRLVWQYRPEARQEVPVEIRMRKLLYAIAIGIFIVLLLALPFYI